MRTKDTVEKKKKKKKKLERGGGGGEGGKGYMNQDMLYVTTHSSHSVDM